MKRLARLPVGLLALAVSAGMPACSERSCGRQAGPAGGKAAVAKGIPTQAQTLAQSSQGIADKLRQMVAASAGQRSLDILALSGGGEWGAFGAGFLKGWSERGDRPAFRLVTGTSTGSLIATFAFLGPAYDEALAQAYLGIGGDRDVFEERFFFTLPFVSSLSTTEPLRRLLEKHITPDVVEKVAEEGRRDRLLWVGSVDLEGGAFVPWDLTRIAASGANARDVYVTALMASTAIPVEFPPVDLGGVLYVDGGVRRNIFLIDTIAREIGARRAALGAAAVPIQTTVHCIVNGMRDLGKTHVKPRALAIARRSVDLLLNESTEGNLLRIYVQAQRTGLAFRVTSVPPDMCASLVAASKATAFDPGVMRCLYDEGRRFAREAPKPWRDDPLTE
jgi:hypothetical protein